MNTIVEAAVTLAKNGHKKTALELLAERMSKKEFKEEVNRRKEDGLALRGNTYNYKDEIKNLGGIWDSRGKAWLMPGLNAIKDLERSIKPKIFHNRRDNFFLIQQEEYERKPKQRPSRPSPSGSPTPKQIDFAEKLIRNAMRDGSWHDSDWGQGMSPPKRKDLEKMSKRDISDLIDDLKTV